MFWIGLFCVRLVLDFSHHFPFRNYRVYRKFVDITILLITSEVMCIQSANSTGVKNINVSTM